MADFYVWSGATGAANGSSWANAFVSLSAAIAAAVAVAGDRFFVAHDHAASYAASTTITFPGTPAAPNQILCVNRAGSVPPVSADLATTASEVTTGANNLSLQGSVYSYGVSYSAATGANANTLNLCTSAAANVQRYENCALSMGGTNGGAMTLGNSAGWGQQIDLNNVAVSFAAGGATFRCIGGRAVMTGGSIGLASGAGVISFNPGGSNTGSLTLRGVDLSASGVGRTLVRSDSASSAAIGSVVFDRCKLGAGVTVAAAPQAGKCFNVELIACDSGAAGYREESYRFGGSIVQETTIVRAGGASDGTTAKSLKFVSNANASFIQPLAYDFGPGEWNETAGVARTVSLEIVTDGVTLKNDEAWIEVEYQASAASPIAAVDTSSRKADFLAAGAAQAASAASWTTTGLAAPVKQTLSATITPLMKGEIVARLCIGKPSTTVYVDPFLRVA